MKKFLFSLALVIGANFMNAQTVLFEDSFEDYDNFIIENVGDWTLIDIDKSNVYGVQGYTYPNSYVKQACTVFNSTATTPSMPANTVFKARTGEKLMACFSATTPTNNDWLISPAIELGSSDNNMSFWYRSTNPAYGMEEFNIMISTTDTNVDSFMPIGQTIVTDTSLVWAEFTANLDDYAGQTVYIAINCVSNDQFALLVDDFKVTTSVLGVSELNAKSTAIYPNPVKDVFQVKLSNKFNAENVTVTITDMTGKKVQTFASASSYNVSKLPVGVYVVKITDGVNTKVQKLIKK